jgi:Protein kinase domain
VLVAPDGPRVIDFGVARAAERLDVASSRGAVGTPAYMAPEQASDPQRVSVASDVYSLGATLLFAATGHPPYRGASVLDVLARLATEEPDLSGLPAGLTELITACMQRVPRARPTSPAVLAQLGQFTEASGGLAEDHAYLPEPAMALIGEYQRSPQLTALIQAPGGQAGEDPAGENPGGEAPGDQTTAPSLTELPAAYRPPRRRPGAGGSPSGLAGGWWQWGRAHLAWVGWTAVGAVLVVGGIILGASLTSSGSQPPPAGAPPAAPATKCGPAGQVSDRSGDRQERSGHLHGEPDIPRPVPAGAVHRGGDSGRWRQGQYAVHGATRGTAGRLRSQSRVHHRSSWRERHSGSSIRVRSAEVMMP